MSVLTEVGKASIKVAKVGWKFLAAIPILVWLVIGAIAFVSILVITALYIRWRTR